MAGTPLDIAWLNGKFLIPSPLKLQALAARALAVERGCYTTALYQGGVPVWCDRHARRLKRDASALGLGEIDEAKVMAALEELGSAAFGAGSGIVRVTAYLGDGGTLDLLAEARDLSGHPDQWSARLSPEPFESTAKGWTGAKGSNFAFYDRMREYMAEWKCDELLLFDRDGFVIEGSRSNLFIVDDRGALVAPNLSRGAVAGLAQELVHDRVPDVVVRDMTVAELDDVREIIAVNAVRHACPIVRLDGKPVGSGEPGIWHRRILETLSTQV